MKPPTAYCNAFSSSLISTCFGYCPGAISSTVRVFFSCSMLVLLKFNGDFLPGARRIHQGCDKEAAECAELKKCKTDEKVQHSITSVNADAGQFLLVNHQGNAVLRQVFLEKVDLVNGQ